MHNVIMPINKICIICSKQFKVPPVREKTALVCSTKCRAELQKKRSTKRINFICENCGKEYKRFNSTVNGKRHFCSVKCANEGKTICVFKCEICGKVFHRPMNKGVIARFCSRKCAYPQLKIERNPINHKCLQCGKEMHRSRWQIESNQKLYCSKECSATHQTIPLNKYSMKERVYSSPEWKKIRLKVLERDNGKCMVCGYDPENKSKLQVHHKQKRQTGGSDELNNLITLCFSCHASVHHGKIPISELDF